MKNKTIHAGEEILFAYHASYWQRWGMNKKRGRKPNPLNTQARDDNRQVVQRLGAAAETNVAGPSKHNENDDVPECILENNGTRVAATAPRPESAGQGRRGRGRPRKQKLSSTPIQKRNRSNRTQQWSATGRDEFNRVQHQGSYSQCNSK